MSKKKTAKIYKAYLKEMLYCVDFCKTYAFKIVEDESIQLTEQGQYLLTNAYTDAANCFDALEDFMIAENLDDKRRN